MPPNAVDNQEFTVLYLGNETKNSFIQRIVSALKVKLVYSLLRWKSLNCINSYKHVCRVLILDRYSATLKLESQELVEAVGGRRRDQS